MRIVCWQMILMKYLTLLLLKIRKDVLNFVFCSSHDWRFKGLSINKGADKTSMMELIW